MQRTRNCPDIIVLVLLLATVLVVVLNLLLGRLNRRGRLDRLDRLEVELDWAMKSAAHNAVLRMEHADNPRLAINARRLNPLRAQASFCVEIDLVGLSSEQVRRLVTAISAGGYECSHISQLQEKPRIVLDCDRNVEAGALICRRIFVDVFQVQHYEAIRYRYYGGFRRKLDKKLNVIWNDSI